MSVALYLSFSHTVFRDVATCHIDEFIKSRRQGNLPHQAQNNMEKCRVVNRMCQVLSQRRERVERRFPRGFASLHCPECCAARMGSSQRFGIFTTAAMEGQVSSCASVLILPQVDIFPFLSVFFTVDTRLQRKLSMVSLSMATFLFLSG
jgi:hypothetical protein